jgi:hypothetical protein
MPTFLERISGPKGKLHKSKAATEIALSGLRREIADLRAAGVSGQWAERLAKMEEEEKLMVARLKEIKKELLA